MDDQRNSQQLNVNSQLSIFGQLGRNQLGNTPLNLFLGALNINGKSIPFPLRFLENLQLRVHHATLHIMRFALVHAVKQHTLAQFEVDEVDLHRRAPVGGDAHDIAVFLLQRGAGDDDA